MSKSITSTVEKFKGSVIIADPLNLAQARLIEAGMTQPEGEDGRVWLSVIDENQLPAVIACVEKWEVENIPEGVTLDNFPATPRKQSHELVSFVFGELLKVYFGELKIPNE
jgi:hypothetical protein